MIETVRLKIAGLQAAAARRLPEELDVIPTGLVHDTWLAVDDRYVTHLFLANEAGGLLPDPPDALTVAAREVRLGGVGRRVIDVSCIISSLDEVFEDFVAAVLERMANTSSTPAASLAEVLGDWRRFLVIENSAPGADRLAGVFGELLVLEDLVTVAPSAVLAWTHKRHDFRAGNHALEVKTTTSPTSYAVTIHGEDQLLEPLGGTLSLHFVRLERTPGTGRSVASMVDSLLQMGVSAAPLYDGLVGAGIAPVDLRDTADVRFDVRERVTLAVDDQLPRIIPRSFVGGSRPAGIDRFTYQLTLDSHLARSLDDSHWRSLLHQIVAEVAA